MKDELKQLMSTYKELYFQVNKRPCELLYEHGWISIISHNGMFPTKVRAKELAFAILRLRSVLLQKN